MACNMATVLVLWILCLFSITNCWDLKTLEPVSCPESKTEDGLCYEMVEQQVRCVNISIDHCEGNIDFSHSFRFRNGICLRTSAGFCTLYSCQTRCCDEEHDDYDDKCDSPYCNKQCENGGTCLRTIDYDVIMENCVCPEPYYGEYCEKVRCEDECENGGTCLVDGSSTVCKCKKGYYGKTCSDLETDIPMSCPKPNKTSCCGRHGHCRHKCWLNSECEGGTICCNDGCCRKCIRPVVCYFNGKQYSTGDTVTDKCKECRCQATGQMECSEFTCPTISCKDGVDPVTKEDSCCPVCPYDDSHRPPVFRNCNKDGTKLLPVRAYTRTGFLEDLKIRAYDYKREALLVTFTKDYINHCRCPYPDRPKVYAMALATDDHGETSTCGFWVIVTDPNLPVYSSCPADIFAVEGETVTWNQPRANDYVGVQYASCDRDSGEVLPIGDYTVTCSATDYDDNKAYCQFSVYVYDPDTSVMQPGLASRRRKESTTAYIVASTFSTVFFIVILVLVVCFIKQRRGCSRRGRHARDRSRERTPPIQTISNPGLYNECGIPVDVKLPPYSPQIEPPTYEDIQFGTGDTMPPSYQDVTTDGAASNGTGRGYLNAAYESIAHINPQQDTPTSEEDIYAEIRLN